MAHLKKPLSEQQVRIQLLAHLGFVPGKTMGDAQALVNWHFGTRGTFTDAQGKTWVKPVPGKTPLLVPSRVIAKFIAFYAANILPGVRSELVRTFNLEMR